MKIGFIGLGNVGFKLANSLLETGFDISVYDLDRSTAQQLENSGAKWVNSPREISDSCNICITCLPSPSTVSKVLEGEDGLLKGLSEGKLWIEMSTTDSNEMNRLSELVANKGSFALEAPVSGGCHRASTGNIAILVGGSREAFEMALPALKAMGHEILHVGEIGSASILKVVTNFLASTHLVALGEALMVCKKSGLDLPTVFKGIKISSGNSFVHETESQVIMNGSYNINFTMDLVCKDVGLFDQLTKDKKIPAEISPLLKDIFQEGRSRFGDRAWSSMIVKRLEEACETNLRADGFPAELVDETPRREGYEVK